MSTLRWRYFALVLALATPAKSAYAQNTTFSTQWAFSPVFYVPLETGIVAYNTSSTGAAVLHANAGDIATGSSNVIINQTLAGDSVLAAFSAAIGTGFVATGSDFGFAFADGIGFSDGVAIFSNAVSSSAATGSGSSSSSVNSATTQDVEANSTSSANIMLNASSTLDLSTNAQATAELQTPTGAVSFNSGYFRTTAGGSEIYTLNNSMLGGVYTPITTGSAAIGIAVQRNGQLEIDTNLAGAGTNLSSNFAYTSATSVTGASFAESVVARTNFLGSNTVSSTIADDAPAHKVALFAEKAADSEFELSANSFRSTTSGDNSTAFLTALRGNSSASNKMTFSGNDTTVQTNGNGASAILGLASAGPNGASQTYEFAGNNTSVRTHGDGSYGVHASSSAVGDATNTIRIFGQSSTFSTFGENATALSSWAISKSKANNEIAVSGDHSMLSTSGKNSHAITSIAKGETGSSNRLVLSGHNASVTTRADSAVGYLSLVSDETKAVSSTNISGNNSEIVTRGLNSHGIISMAAGNDAASNLSLTGAGSRIATFGDNAAGVSLMALGLDYGSSYLSLSGTNASIQTNGDYATGAYLGSSGGTAAVNLAELTGYNSKVVTAGDYSSGITFAGASSTLRVSGVNAGVFTSGLGSHAVLSDTERSEIEIGKQSKFVAIGPGSDGLYIKQQQAKSTIKNYGRVSGQRNGVNSNGSISAINTGSIIGNTDAGVSFDNGYIYNTGRIKGPSAILAKQLLGGAVVIDTPGEISSSNGPSAIAIDLQGSGNDQLIVSPYSTIIGTIDMGVGFDTLTARKGTNADLRVASPFEKIETHNRNSLLTLLDGGTRILIADPSLHVNVVHLVSDQFSSLSQNRQPNIDVQWANETPNICQPYLGIDFSSAQTMAGISMIESSINGLRINYTSDECRDVSVDLNLGYYAVSAAAGSAATEGIGVFGFGSAFSFDLAENTSAKLYSNLGLLDGSIRRRIMNNTLDSGFEYATGTLNGWFVNSGTLIETDLVRSNYSLTPYAAAELGFANTSRFSEMDTSFGLDINEHSSFRYRVATGVEATSIPFQWNDNAFVQFSGSVSTSYSDRIDASKISSSLANEVQPLIESGPYSELSIDLGAKIRFWSDNRNSKAEFQFLHRKSNRNSSSNSISGSFALVF